MIKPEITEHMDGFTDVTFEFPLRAEAERFVQHIEWLHDQFAAGRLRTLDDKTVEALKALATLKSYLR